MCNLKLMAVLILMVVSSGSVGLLLSQQPASPGAANPVRTGAGTAQDGGKAQPTSTDKSSDADRLAETFGDVEILNDTMGTDFRPYLQRVVFNVRKNWLNRMPEVARPPILKSGTVVIEFVILKDGKVLVLKIGKSSGNDLLDRAPKAAIIDSSPFPPFPAEFKGQYLSLRFRFSYNPAKDAPPPPDKVPGQDTTSPKNPEVHRP